MRKTADWHRLLKPSFAERASMTEDGVVVFSDRRYQFRNDLGEDIYETDKDYDGDRADATLREFLIETCRTKLPFATGLDFGCGAGRTITTFADLVKLPIGIELSLNRVKAFARSPEAKRIRPTLINHQGNLPFRDNSLDFVSFITVYEHLRDPAPYLLEFHRVLKPGGILFSVNDTWCYEKIASLGIRSVAKKDRTHINMQTPDRMTDDIRIAGFTILRKAYLPFYRWGFRATPRILNRFATKGMVIAQKHKGSGAERQKKKRSGRPY